MGKLYFTTSARFSFFFYYYKYVFFFNADFETKYLWNNKTGYIINVLTPNG